MTQSKSFRWSLMSWVMNFRFLGRHVQLSQQKNSGERLNVANGGRLIHQWGIVPYLWIPRLLVLQMITNWRHWTSIHISSMHSVIMFLRSSFLGLQIHFLLSWCVNDSLSCMEQSLKLYWQGELEHWISKSCYACTSHKTFVPQLASIEHHQAHIHCICAQREAQKGDNPSPDTPDLHHVIGKSQIFPEDIGTFMQKNLDDPAVNMSLLA